MGRDSSKPRIREKLRLRALSTTAHPCSGSRPIHKETTAAARMLRRGGEGGAERLARAHTSNARDNCNACCVRIEFLSARSC